MGSDYHPLWKSLQGKNTGWCTAGEEVAKSQLENGDFYIYYTKDKNDEYNNPRIAIRMNGKEEIGEASEIPRYFIPGFYGTKAVRMNHVLDNMITSFSEEKNMSQKEIVEVAIVEFFLKYGDADLMNEYMD